VGIELMSLEKKKLFDEFLKTNPYNNIKNSKIDFSSVEFVDKD